MSEPLTSLQKIDITFKIISSVGVIVAAAALYFSCLSLRSSQDALTLAIQSFRDAHEWNRRQFTMVVVGNYTKDTGADVHILTAKWPGLYTGDIATSMTRKEAEGLFNATAEKQKQLYTLRKSVVDYLNYVEYVCAVDRKTIEAIYGGIFKRDLKFFGEFISAAQSEFGKDAWAPILRVVGEWQRKDSAAEKNQPETGQ